LKVRDILEKEGGVMGTAAKSAHEIDHSRFAKPDLNTSRRNFLAAASTLATAGVFGWVWERDQSEPAPTILASPFRAGTQTRKSAASSQKLASRHLTGK
jgi:hypothetical protein